MIGLAVVSVFLLAYGPRLLGNATDLIFGAFLADRPVDFDAVRTVLVKVLAIYVVARCWPGARATSSTTSCRGRCAGCARRRGQGQRPAAGGLRQAAAR